MSWRAEAIERASGGNGRAKINASTLFEWNAVLTRHPKPHIHMKIDTCLSWLLTCYKIVSYKRKKTQRENDKLGRSDKLGINKNQKRPWIWQRSWMANVKRNALKSIRHILSAKKIAKYHLAGDNDLMRISLWYTRVTFCWSFEKD